MERLVYIDILKGIDDIREYKLTEDSKDIIKLNSVLKIFFDKYLPFNVSVNTLTIQGISVVDFFPQGEPLESQ